MPLAALGGCPPVGLSPEAAGKGRKAPYGVLQRESPLSTLYLLEALGESLGKKHLSTDLSHFSRDFLMEVV